eukprot:1082157-Rhodomonas_salina.5
MSLVHPATFRAVPPVASEPEPFLFAPQPSVVVHLLPPTHQVSVVIACRECSHRNLKANISPISNRMFKLTSPHHDT